MHAPPINHAHPQQPCMPPGNYTCPTSTTHTPQQPRTPQQPCMPLQQPHMPPTATHAPRCMPSGNHTCPPSWQPHMSPRQPCTPPGNQANPPPVDRITDTCKNITFPQLRLRAVTSLVNSTVNKYC